MNILSLTLAYLATGAVAGLLSGLFGIGGGLVMVPVLLACFSVSGAPVESIPALALGTSLTSICFASAMASREHFRIGNLAEPFSPRTLGFAAYLAGGVVAGAGLCTHLPRQTVLVCIALFQLAVAAWMFRGTLQPAAPRQAPTADVRPAQALLNAVPARAFFALTGAVSSIGGIGGATLMIPYFSLQGIEYRQAAALSTFFGCVIGAFGFIAYGLLAHPSPALPMSIGFVSLPAFAGMAMGSLFLARAGARLSQRLSRLTLTRGFCVFLVVSAARLLLSLLNPDSAIQ
jgi:uncharacterized membrane protein YfcA